MMCSILRRWCEIAKSQAYRLIGLGFCICYKKTGIYGEYTENEMRRVGNRVLKPNEKNGIIKKNDEEEFQ